MKRITGTGVALITPFKDDLSVDTEALEKIVNYVIDGGVNYLVVLGTTAETATLTNDEKLHVINTVVKTNAGRKPLVLGVGGNNTAAVVAELKARDLSHFDAVLSVSPYYNKPTQEGIYQHFKAIALASPKPIILYNVPSRTASNISANTTLRLAKDFSNIIAIKEASGDFVQISKIIKEKPSGFLVLSGDDMNALQLVLAGGDGVISVIGQGLPSHFSEMIRLGLNRACDEAYKFHYQLFDLMQLIFEEGNPAGIKTVYNQLGLCTQKVRLPLVEASSELQKKIATNLEGINSMVHP